MYREPLSGGLRTAIDPALLDPGELVDARNAIYLAGSPALWRSPGRTAFGTVSAVATAVDGLRDVQFDNGDAYLVALADSKLRYAPVGDTGTFTDLTTLATAGLQLERAQYRNRYYLFNGAAAAATSIGSNVVAYLSATGAGTAPSVRQHGMRPVNAAPVTASANAVFSQTVTGYYEYWTTEVARFTQDGSPFEMESTFQGSPATMFVSATSYAPVLTRPEIQNPGTTTHWRVYRSPKKDFATDKEFPAGFMIAEVATATAQVTDTLTSSNTGLIFPTTYNSGVAFSDFTNASNLGADDGSVATVSATLATNSWTSPKFVAQGAYGFNFAGFKGQVVGIEVEVQGFVDVAPCTVGVYIGPRDSITGGFKQDFTNANHVIADSGLGFSAGGKNFVITSTSAGAPTTVTLGGPADRWFAPSDPGLQDSDFDTNFMVVLAIANAGVKNLSFDYVRVRAYYGATITSSTIQFPAVTYTFGDITAEVGKNGQPPSSSTGDFFEDQLVVNDASNSSLIRFSYPGDPDAFPSTYYVDYETAENDQVRAIKVVNDRLVVWLDSSTWRQNYLPSERDASFDRGKSRSIISSQYGCLSPMCVATFSPGGGTDLAAFVSHHGVHATDGFELSTYTADLNWDAIFPAGSNAIALINDRKRRLLLFYFQNTANFGNETFLCLPFAYGAGHWQNDRPKVCGFLHMRNKIGGQFASLESAWSVQRANGAVSVYLGYGGTDTGAGAGKVFIESGTSIPAEDPRWQATTRDLYLGEGGIGSEFRLGKVYGYAHDQTAGTQLTYTVTTRKTDAGATTGGTKTVTLSNGQKVHAIGDFHQQCESASFAIAATATAYGAELLLFDGLDFGKVDPA